MVNRQIYRAEKIRMYANQLLRLSRAQRRGLQERVDEEARRGTAGEGREAKRGHVAKIQGKARSVKREERGKNGVA